MTKKFLKDTMFFSYIIQIHKKSFIILFLLFSLRFAFVDAQVKLKQNSFEIQKDLISYKPKPQFGMSIENNTSVLNFFNSTNNSCISPYFKLLRGQNFREYFDYFFLMQNRILFGVVNNGTYRTLQLFDEAGNYIKGAQVLINGTPTNMAAYQMSDKRIMLILNSSEGNVSSFTLILVSDNLDIIWTKTIQSTASFESMAELESSIHMDSEGSFYIVGRTSDLFLDPKATIDICKLDSLGSLIWQKKFEFPNLYLGQVAATTSDSSLYVIASGSNGGSVSIRVNRQNGNLQNCYKFNELFDGNIFRRYAQYLGGRILFVGSDKNSNLSVMQFDENARPIKMKSILNSSIPRAFTYGNEMFFVNYNYYSGGTKNVILKLNFDLNLQFIKEFDDGDVVAKGIAVCEDGSLLEGGFRIIEESKASSYIAKYDPAGNRGTCKAYELNPIFDEVTLIVENIGYKEIAINTQFPDRTVELKKDVSGLWIYDSSCIKNLQCKTIKITGEDTICQMNTEYIYNINKDISCTAPLSLSFDSSYCVVKEITDTSIRLFFKKSGSVQILATITEGCNLITDSIQIIIQPTEQSFTLGKDRILCKGDSILLSVGAGLTNYLWSDKTTNSFLLVKQTGTYTVQAENACGVILRDTIVIQSIITPELLVIYDTIVCKGSVLPVSANPGFISYTWIAGNFITVFNNNAQVLVDKAQTIFIEAFSKEGCMVRDSLKVNIDSARHFTLGNDTGFCASSFVKLNVDKSYKSYYWNDGSVDTVFIINHPGKYWLKATDYNGCSMTDSIIITTYPKPEIGFQNEYRLCTGDSIILDAGNFVDYKWNNGATSRMYTAQNPGEYIVSVKNSFGCSVQDTAHIIGPFPSPSDFLPAMDSICFYSTATIETFNTFDSYSWSTGSFNKIIKVDQPGIYTLKVKDNNGCIGVDSTKVVIRKDCISGVFIPNAFTPNGDNLNDLFRAITNDQITSFRLEVYDRYGNLIFKTINPKKGWDGTVKGIPMPSGLFAWQCFFQLDGQELEYMKGSVILLR